MKVSYDWLQTFFDGKLPSTDVVGEALTFHSFELEEMVPVGDDTMLDIKVLPDKSAWALSHRGIAKDLSVTLKVPLARDPLKDEPGLAPLGPDIVINLETDTCTRYTAALIKGVTVGPSPEWLQKRLKTIGQRSVNNVVDSTNYVMFELGQPLHAFDAGKLGGTKITVRKATEGEEITTLTGETYTLTTADAVIADGITAAPIGIAGIKGGKAAEVDADTIDILLESANFNAVAVRKTTQHLKLRTDASTRYENGVVPEMAAYGLKAATALIMEIAGGQLAGYADTGLPIRKIERVSVPLEKINSELGMTLAEKEIADIMERFGYVYTLDDGVLTVTPPFERTDIIIPEDVIEEIGRVHGYTDVPSVTPEPIALTERNKHFYYSEVVRDVLTELGFSEIYTSSFRAKDAVKLANALASDKGYLRSSLRENMEEALLRNVPHKDLLGLPFIGLFEIGTVFAASGERFNIAIGVRHGAEYKEKTDKKVLDAALVQLEERLGKLQVETKDGIAECNFGVLLETLPEPDAYAPFTKTKDVSYVPYSPYPSVSRDIAFWVHDGTSVSKIETLLRQEAGDLCVRLTLFDTFEKDGRTSYGFRLVFQSYEKTLTDAEVNAVMDRVYERVIDCGFETR